MEDSSYRDLCSLDDVTSTLGITLAVDDPREPVLTRLIKAASDEIYSFTDREFISATKDYWDDPTDTEDRVYDVGWYGLGRNVVEIGDLMEEPTEVAIYHRSDVIALVDPADYELFPKVRQKGWPYQFIRFMAHHTHSSYAIHITGKWGFPIVPEDVRNGCIMTVREWYDAINLHSSTVEQELIAGQPRRNLPPGVVVSLNKYHRYKS